MSLTVEQMFYGVWCHSTLRTKSDMPLVMQALYLFKSWQSSERNWARQSYY